MTTSLQYQHPTRAIVSLSAFRNNLGVVRAHVGKDVRIMAIVKANAYGHGAVRLASEAINAGAEYLGVARVFEGTELRDAGIEQRMLVFEVVPRGAEEAAISNELELTVVDAEGAGRLNDVASKLGRKIKVHAKIDTGMGRLGMDYREAANIVERAARLKSVELAGIYSHFATSDDADLSFAREQHQHFTVVLEELHRRKVDVGLRHMANSGAILTLPESYFDMVRPGIMIYGYPPRRGMKSKSPLQPVLSLVSNVAMLKSVDARTSISYSRKYFTKAKTHIATIPIGYADGFVRLLTNRTEAIINGRRYPVVGTVCMDHVMVDVGADSAVHEGDEVVLIGERGAEVIDGWDIAERVGTIPYEVTCLITQRVPRIYEE
jgi:alanine racemase